MPQYYCGFMRTPDVPRPETRSQTWPEADFGHPALHQGSLDMHRSALGGSVGAGRVFPCLRVPRYIRLPDTHWSFILYRGRMRLKPSSAFPMA